MLKQITLCVGSVYGAAQETAKAIQTALQQEGWEVSLHLEPQVSAISDNEAPVLICTSTTGSGELPENIAPFYVGLTTEFPNIVGRPFGVIALGDSSYHDSFGGAGDLMFEAMTELAATPVKPLLKIDAQETSEPESVAVPWALSLANELATA